MLKIITKSAHNALLYQIEDLKKKLESANENIESYKEDLDDFEKAIKAHNEGMVDAKVQFDKLNVDLNNAKKNANLYASRHKSCVLRNESLTTENHRLGNLLQVKCDEVKTLEKKVDSTSLLTKDYNQLEANADAIEIHVIDAINILDVPHANRNKCVKDAVNVLKDALKIRQ